MLEDYIRGRLEQKRILLMTHIVLGYPSFEDSLRLIDAMVDADVDLIEMQIPFSEPIADGPVILRANQEALQRGATVARCLELAAAAAQRVEIPLLFMSYYNVLYRHGVAAFVAAMKERGLRGAIVPDLPPEEATDYLSAMSVHGLAPIFIYSPNTPDARLRQVAEHASGFVYCVARKGVTGAATDFSGNLEGYLARCRAATALPLAVGFGVKSRQDVAFLEGKAEIAVVGSQTLRLVEEQGVAAVSPFLQGLRA